MFFLGLPVSRQTKGMVLKPGGRELMAQSSQLGSWLQLYT
jgi:hypothetical protein